MSGFHPDGKDEQDKSLNSIANNVKYVFETEPLLNDFVVFLGIELSTARDYLEGVHTKGMFNFKYRIKLCIVTKKN